MFEIKEYVEFEALRMAILAAFVLEEEQPGRVLSYGGIWEKLYNDMGKEMDKMKGEPCSK